MTPTQTVSTIALTALIAALGATNARAEVEIEPIAGFDIGFSGLIQYDFNRFDVDGIDYRDDENLRRAELKLAGERGNWSWSVGYDVEGEKYLDNYLGFAAGPARITLGQFKQPIGLEELSSTKNNDFIAKAMATNAFATSRRLGGRTAFGGDNWTLTASLFDGELTEGDDAGSGVAARATFAPIQDEGRLVHLGVSAVQADPSGETIRFRARPNADLAGLRPVDTGAVGGVDDQLTVGLEGIWAQGPLKLQGEYLTTSVGRNGPLDDFSGDSWYLSGMWNLTGESWGYRSGVIRTPGASRPTSGMWQAGLRYDRIDLDDEDVSGGTMRGITLGVNYYWRSNWKLAANWVQIESRRAGETDEPDILEFRAQFYW